MMRKLVVGILSVLIIALAMMISPRPAQGYIEVAFTLGKIVGDSTNIVLMRVESVDKVKHTITYKKVEDIKGKHPTEIIKHNIAEAGFSPREWQSVMAWAEVGQMAVMFHNVTASETCINNYWYQCYPKGEWWDMFHAEPYLLRSYAGKPEKLVPLVKQILEGKEVIVTAMVDGDKNLLHTRTARVQRLKASLKIQDYDAKRDFVGWGGDELKQISMAGFTHYSPFTRTSLYSGGGGRGGEGTLTLDFDGDGKPDFVLYGENRAGLYLGDGTSTNEVILPLPNGARDAAVGRFRNDKFADLIFATAGGPKLISNIGNGGVRDDSAALPAQKYYNTTAVAVLDYDGDGKPDILVADGFSGLHLYRNLSPRDSVREAAPKFEDVTEKVGLGANGLCGDKKGTFLAAVDVDADGRDEVVFVADKPYVLQFGAGKFALKDVGMNFSPANRPAFVKDDGLTYFAVPGAGKVSLYQCKDHQTALKTALAVEGEATSVAFADFDGDGKKDLLVGVVRGPNRYFRNMGGGKFEDATESLGLSQRIFNTRALAVIDLNKDGAADLLLNNDGQEPVLLLGNPMRRGAK